MEIDEGIVTSEGDEKREVERLSVVATFGILVATIAAAVAGSLAALAGVHSDTAATNRVAWATYSNETLLAYNEYAANQGETVSIEQEDAWRVRLLEDLADDTTDPTLRLDLNTEALVAGSGSRAPSAARPSFASPGTERWCKGLEQPYDCAYEVANEYATTSLGYDQQERAFIACVSILAIALFLFALSKMLNQPSMEKLFIGLGALLTLIAVGWMVAEPLVTPARPPSEAAIRAYEKGWQLEQLGRASSARTVEADLTAATSDDPSMADAWQQLGEEQLLYASGARATRCQHAVASLTRAQALRLAPEDADRLAIAEVLCGQPSRALRTLREDPSDASDVSAGSTLALTQLALGRSHQATKTLDAAVRNMARHGDGVRGPVFVSYWFDQLFTEVDALDAGQHPPAGFAVFISRMQHDEARAMLRSYGLTIPGPSRTASVHVTVTDASTVFGSAWGLVPVTLDLRYSGLRAGQVISVMWDQAHAVESDRLISVTLPGTSIMIVGKPGGPLPGSGTFVVPAFDVLAPGSYLLDLSVDAVAQSKPVAVVISAPHSSSGPTPVPLGAPELAFTGPPMPTPTPTPTTTPPTTTTTTCENTTTTSTTTTTTLFGATPVPPLSTSCGPPSSQ